MDLIIKGFIIGIGKIMPGVSGSLLAIRLNIYENIIYAINNIFNNFYNSAIYLSKLAIGIILAIVLGSHAITFLLNNYYHLTIFIFLILIGTGIPLLLKETNKYYISLISFIIYFLILYMPKLDIINNYYFIGFIEAITTIIPGISGTAIFMSLGLYDDLLSMFTNIYTFPLDKIIPFSIGLFIGTIIIVRFTYYCFKNYRQHTYATILGLLLASMLSIIIKR